jgi:hypothetical protein
MADTADGALTTTPEAAPVPLTQLVADALAVAKAYAR